MRLVDYKVRIIDGNAATAARTRVIIDSIDEELEWSTMGSDTNIIAASAQALADSLEYAIWKRERDARGRGHRRASAEPAVAGEACRGLGRRRAIHACAGSPA